MFEYKGVWTKKQINQDDNIDNLYQLWLINEEGYSVNKNANKVPSPKIFEKLVFFYLKVTIISLIYIIFNSLISYNFIKYFITVIN